MLGCIYELLCFVFVQYRPCFAIKYFKIGSCLLWPSVIIKSCHIHLLFYDLSITFFYWYSSSLLYQYYKIKFITILLEGISHSVGCWGMMHSVWSLVCYEFLFRFDVMIGGNAKKYLAICASCEKILTPSGTCPFPSGLIWYFHLSPSRPSNIIKWPLTQPFQTSEIENVLKLQWIFTADFKGQLSNLLNGIRGLTALLYSPPPLFAAILVVWLSSLVSFQFVRGCSHEEEIVFAITVCNHRS